MTHARPVPRLIVAMGVLVALLGATALTQSPGVHPVSGRVYARTMGVAGAPWLDRSEREAEERVTRAVALMNIAPGSVVADVGAGSGYVTRLLAKQVGSRGRVYANDIQPGMLDLLRRRLERERITNVTPVLGTQADPNLPDGALDLVLMVDVYHELSEPQTMLANIRTALKAGGRLMLLEYKGEDPSVPILPDHKMTVAQAKLEIEHEGYSLVSVDSSLPWQHLLTFTPTDR